MLLDCAFAHEVLVSRRRRTYSEHHFGWPTTGDVIAAQRDRIDEVVHSPREPLTFRDRDWMRYGPRKHFSERVLDDMRVSTDWRGVVLHAHSLAETRSPTIACGKFTARNQCRIARFGSVLPVILSDVSIRKALADGRIVIDPLHESAIQPSSVDLRVDHYFRVFRNHATSLIDPKKNQEDLTELVTVDGDDPFILHPGEFVLASTLERVAVSDDLVGRLEGKSSLGRLGLLIHTTAGFVDSGFDGYLTLELSNVANLPIALYPEMKIGQISFLQMTTPAEVPYGGRMTGSKYQGQRGPTPSRYYLNFDRP